MTEEKKKYKNLTTYAVVMILAMVIVIIIAAMADNREEKFENTIYQQQQTNESIQNEIVRLTDENYGLSKKIDEIEKKNGEMELELKNYRALEALWTLTKQKKYNEAAEVYKDINPEELTETQEEAYYIIIKNLPADKIKAE